MKYECSSFNGEATITFLKTSHCYIKNVEENTEKRFFTVGDSEKSRMWIHCMSCLVHFLLRVLSIEASG
jgi:hypothetical protein